MAAICPWPCLDSAPTIKETKLKKSFAQMLQDSCEVQIKELPSPVIKGDSVYIKITQEEYEKGLADCRRNLHGRVLWNKGDRPLTAKDLRIKLFAFWKTSHSWQMVSLGRGFYEFHFDSFEDMRLAWSSGTVNLKPGLLRLSKWTNDFSTSRPRQTHAQVWIRLMELPQEYWRQRTLFEIASAMGTPLTLDDSTKHRTFGHYARILVDMDLSRRIFDEVVVEREGFALKIEVIYERLPDFCSHCQTIGHNIHTCKWLQPMQSLESKPITKAMPAAKAIKQEYVAKARQTDTFVSEHKQQNPSNTRVAEAKVMHQYTDAASLGNNNDNTSPVVVSDSDSWDEEMEIVVEPIVTKDHAKTIVTVHDGQDLQNNNIVDGATENVVKPIVTQPHTKTAPQEI
ncbi:putative NBS resistance protein, partial [Trifolium pratense]